jgi:hypothetical protein
MNGANQEITHPADNDHGRNGPHYEHRHNTLLLVLALQERTLFHCQLFPVERSLIGHGSEYDSQDRKTYGNGQHPPNGAVKPPFPFLEGVKFPLGPF